MNIHLFVFVYLSLLNGDGYLLNCYPQNNIIAHTNRTNVPSNAIHARVFYDQLTTFIMNVDWLPIEINVPETISGAMNGISSMWTSLNEYYQSWSESNSTPRRNSTKLKRVSGSIKRKAD